MGNEPGQTGPDFGGTAYVVNGLHRVYGKSLL